MDAVTFDLPASLDIGEIGPYFKEITKSISQLNESSNVSLDAQRVSSIDTTGLQLLVALVLELTSRNIKFNWQNVPFELSDGARSLGLSQTLKLQ